MADGEPSQSGRPTTYTVEVATIITTRIMGGESLRAVCRDEAMPARSTVHLWIAMNKAFSDQYARACEIRAEEMFDEMFDIADNSANDYMLRGSGEDATEVVNSEAIQRSRLRIDTRKWALSKMNPKKYGEKITQEVVGKDGGPIATTQIDAKKLNKAQLEALASIRIPADSR